MSIYESKTPNGSPGPWYGLVAKGATDLFTTIEVIIPGFSDDYRFTHVRWQSRDDTSLPQRDDECLVMFDDKGHAWVTAWWPFG